MSTTRASRTFSLQTLLVTLSALATLPLLAFALWLLQLVWQNGRADARRDLQQVAATLAASLDRELAGSVRELQRLAEFPTLAPGRLQEFHAYARTLVERNSGWDNVVITDLEGDVLLNAALPFSDVPPLRVDVAHLAQVRRTGLPAVSDVYESRRTGGAAIGVAVPVIRDGAVRWVLSARLRPDVLSRFVGDQLYRDGAIAAVVDRQARIVARSRDAERFFGEPATGDLQAALRVSPERGVDRLTTLDGATVLAAWQRLPSGWTVTIGVPAGVLDDALRRSFGVLLAFGLIVLAAGVGASVLLGRSISRSIEAVSLDARALAAGAPVTARRSPITQVAALFESLREASRVQREKEEARDRAVAALRDADRRKDEFLAMLAHELRNPLAPLRNAIGVLARTLGADPIPQRTVAMADRQVRQLTRLVDDLLDVSRITQGKIALDRRPIAVSDAVSEAVEAIRPALEQRGQRIAVRLPPSSPVARADGLRLAQVLENLLSNASKYTDPGGFIEISVTDTGEGIEIRVRDTGIGLPPEQLDRVFDLFTQVESGSDRAQGGLGIGLSLVRTLVELHGGRVSAHSDGPGRGACFVVRLPHEADVVEA
ncbi:MAG: sensor histidine kinase [Burkholderiales bacterium]|nr:MAG: sensor histidine kinase [Burkholderiales bacterium]